jgi:photosystem II stability/assembly factor-like uncharacterized protein
MRLLLTFLLTTTALAQYIQPSHTTESLRGVSSVSAKTAWASGTHGTYLRTTDAGAHWQAAQVPGAEALDFRAVVAFSADEAFLMSAGPGDQSRIYHTVDAGQHWQLQFKNENPKGFFDSMIFLDRTHGVALGDPVPDETGKLKFELLTTEDGQTWQSIPPAQLPPAVEGEGAFAASNSCLAVVPVSGPKSPWKSGASAPAAATTSPRDPFKNSAPSRDANLHTDTVSDHNLWFATGGSVARVFHSPDRGQTWEVFNTPIVHGADSTGIFSIAFRDPFHGVIAGGDYKHPDQDGPNLAFTNDGGKTWTLSPIKPQAFFSAAAYDRKNPQRLFLVAQDFIYEVSTPSRPHRTDLPKISATKLNAASPNPAGGALLVGSKGEILSIP